MDSRCVVVTGKNAGLQDLFASQQLARYLEAMTGSPAETTSTDLIPDARGKGKAVFLVGLPSSHPQIGKRIENPLQEEEIFIDSSSGCTVCSGGSPRAVLFAVYDFLEKDCGVRWYYPDAGDEIVPRLQNGELRKITAGVGMRRVVPSFSYRDRMFLNCQAHTQEEPVNLAKLRDHIDWMAKIKMNVVWFNFREPDCAVWKTIRELFPEIHLRGLKIAVGDHCYRYFLSPQKYFQEHPDWFPLLGEGCELSMIRTGCNHVQFCLSNPDARATFIRNVVEYLHGNPEIDYLSIWPNDFAGWCQCETCRETPQPDQYLALDNELAAALGSAGYKTRLFHFAYATHLDTPDFVKPSGDLDILFCTWGRDYSISLSDSGSEKRREIIENWRGACGSQNRFILHEKYARTHGYGFHLLPLKILAKDIAYLKIRGVDGIQLHTEMNGWWIRGLSLYVIAALLWDANTSVDGLLSEYFDRYYAGVGPRVREVYERIDEAFPSLKYYTPDNYSIPWPFWSRVYRLGLKNAPDDLDARRQHASCAAALLSSCMEKLDQARRDVISKNTALRIGKAREAVQYARRQQEALVQFMIALEHLQRAFQAGSTNPIADFRKADEYLAAAEELEGKNQEAVAQDDGSCCHAGGSGLYWEGSDRPISALDTIQRLHRLVQKKIGAMSR